MERTSTASTRAGLALIAALFGLSVYRAMTQSITTDEALTCLRFVLPRWVDTWKDYDANNHVLNSLLAGLSVKAFGLSEWTLRLPALLGGALYLAGAWTFSRRLFRSGAFFLACLGLLTLNPLVLDHLSLARGYGLALAFWLWAVIAWLDWLENGRPARMTAGAVACALALSANLVFLFPLAALALSLAAAALLFRGRGALPDLADRMIVPAATVAFVILLLPVQSAQPSQLYYGAPDLGTALGELADLSFFRQTYTSWRDPSIVILRWLGAITAGVAALGALDTARRRGRSTLDLFLLVAGPSIVAALAALIALHYRLGMPYPLNRTAIYWVPLLSAAALAVVRRIDRKPLSAVALGLAGLVILRYACQIDPGYYGEWPEDAGIRRMASTLEREAGNRAIRICAPHGRELVLKFYRRKLGMLQWEVVRSDLPGPPCNWEVVRSDAPPPSGRIVHRDRSLILFSR